MQNEPDHGEQDEEHTRAGNGRCSCGAEIVPYEDGESSGCAVAGRPYIYARFVGNDIRAGGELYPDDDCLVPPSDPGCRRLAATREACPSRSRRPMDASLSLPRMTCVRLQFGIKLQPAGRGERKTRWDKRKQPAIHHTGWSVFAGAPGISRSRWHGALMSVREQSGQHQATEQRRRPSA
jgi:hypothetical protein